MATTKVPFKAKHGLQSFEDSTFSKAVTVTNTLTAATNVIATTGITTKKVIQNGTDSMVIPKGTTAQRDAVPSVGAFRANSETNNFEGYIDGSWVILGGTTSLKTGAYQNIELISAAAGLGHEVIAGVSGVRVYRDVAAFASPTASITGAIVFKLPNFSKNGATMMRMRFVGLNYAGNQTSYELDVGGYWTTTGPTWAQLKSISKGSTPVTQVRGGIAADGSPVIILGTDATVWAYPKIVLEYFEVAHGGVVGDWYTDWSTTYVASSAAYTSQVTAVTEIVYTTSNFDPTLKYDKTGGAISGNVSVGGTLTSTGVATFSGSAKSTWFESTAAGIQSAFEAASANTLGAFYASSGASGGSYSTWTTRPTVVQMDCPSNTSAYSILRATNQGTRHLAAMDIYAGGTTSSVPSIVFHIGATTNAFTFDGSGNFTAVGNVTAYSDRRLKKDLKRIEGALDKVSLLTGYTYTRIDTGEVQTGLIAQDVQSVLPEAVTVQDNPEQTLAVSYGNMMGLVVEALKELRSEVAALRERVSDLEKL